MNVALLSLLAREIAKTVGRQWALALLALLLIHWLFRRFFDSRRIQDRPFDREAFFHELGASFVTLAVGACIGIATSALVDQGIIHVRTGPVSPWLVVGQFAFYFVAFDLFFYCAHRLFHTDLLYHSVHATHHRSVTPDPLTAFSFHPLEALVMGSFVPLMMFVVNFHLYAIIAVNAYGVLNSLALDSGREFFPARWYRGRLSRFYITPYYHDAHHQLYRCNFGAFTNIWDRVFGTVMPNLVAQYETTRARHAALEESARARPPEQGAPNPGDDELHHRARARPEQLSG